jgi:hypothetical protein
MDIKNAKTELKRLRYDGNKFKDQTEKKTKLTGLKQRRQDLFVRKPIRWKDRVVNLKEHGGFLAKTRGQGGFWPAGGGFDPGGRI